MSSFVRVQVQGEITSKGGKDQGATTDHPRGLRRKVRTSYEKTPLSWSRGWRPQNDTNEGGQVQNVKMRRGDKDRLEPTQKGPGPAGLVGSAQEGFGGSARPLT
jgi:hypothetical protein